MKTFEKNGERRRSVYGQPVPKEKVNFSSVIYCLTIYTLFRHESMFTVYCLLVGIHASFDKLLSKYHISCIR